ncbi:conserved phage C-terminal domain-containing protein [Fictibacillus sp. S7]|uniref:conserved phage C-terminal domain-containing protein n=1 Tax=Fictibacillus sp. S7 TaxID=2212476 RepID=UPI00101107EF|nr:conserved phage C-terminal domain-containing protein [Fictibacillus sp. S7]RXZ00852.1 replication protein [Fictibacillus sp. S7]
MAVYRQIHVTFWQDGFVLDLTPEEKYFYLYLMTNSKTTQCGIYELPKRIIETETGYNRGTVDKLLQKFVEYGKVLYSEEEKEIMIINWTKYNFINSPKVITCIEKELKAIKNKAFVAKYSELVKKRYGYLLDTLSIVYGEEEELEGEREEEKEEEKEAEREVDILLYEEIIDYLNRKAHSSFQTTLKTIVLIKARCNDGFTLNDFKCVIDLKTAEWLNDEKMNKFLRPETLFGTRFESYLNQRGGGDKKNKGKSEDGRYTFLF